MLVWATWVGGFLGVVFESLVPHMIDQRYKKLGQAKPLNIVFFQQPILFSASVSRRVCSDLDKKAKIVQLTFVNSLHQT